MKKEFLKPISGKEGCDTLKKVWKVLIKEGIQWKLRWL